MHAGLWEDYLVGGSMRGLFSLCTHKGKTQNRYMSQELFPQTQSYY